MQGLCLVLRFLKSHQTSYTLNGASQTELDGLSVNDLKTCGLNFPRSTHMDLNIRRKIAVMLALGFPTQTPHAFLFLARGGFPESDSVLFSCLFFFFPAKVTRDN